MTAITGVTPLRSTPIETRQRILATAERLFREIGYQKTTVADIGKALRMSPTNIYRFFESKKAINEAVAERIMAEIEGELSRIATGPGPAAERFRTAVKTYHDMNEARYTANQRMHEMVEVAMTESWDVVSNHIERVHAIYRRIVSEGIASAEFQVTDEETAARCAQVALVRFCHPGLMTQCANQPGPTLDQMIDFVLTALGYVATARSAAMA